MRIWFWRFGLCLVVVFISPFALLSGKSHDLALIGATIYPEPMARPIGNGIVLIRDGQIAAVGEKEHVQIPKNTPMLDCKGLTLLAGFWNTHVHFYFTEPKWQNASSIPASMIALQIQDMLTRYGFAHVLDTGSDLQNTLAIRRGIERDEFFGPSIRTTGTPFVPPNGSPFYIAPIKLPELTAPDEATKLARAQIASGAEAIKLFTASPVSPGAPAVVMPLELAEAAASAAHALGKLVVAHPTNNAGVKVALEAGIDILAHTTPDGGEPWNEELVGKLRSRRIALVPTLKLWKFELERKGISAAVAERFLRIALQQVRAYSQAGGEILFGTDVGYVTDYDPTEEYLLMGRAGMNFRQILASLTTAPAKRFGASNRTGRIAKGMDADLVLLGGDPATNVEAFSNVRYTFRKGKIIFRAK